MINDITIRNCIKHQKYIYIYILKIIKTQNMPLKLKK